MLRLSYFLLAIIACFSQAGAQFDFPSGKLSSEASESVMVSENKSIAPGKPFSVALKISHPTDWHSYYKNSGGVELPPSVEWTLPDGFSAGPIQWPVPEVKDGDYGKSYVYQGSPVFVMEITPPASLEIGKTVTLTANANWQICKGACKSEKGTFTLTLPVTSTGEKDTAQAELFDNARKSQAKKNPSLQISAQSSGGDIQLRIGPASAIQGSPTDFIPDQVFLQPASGGGKIERDGDDWKVTLKRIKFDAIFPKKTIPQGRSFSGILVGPSPIEIPDTIISTPSRRVPAVFLNICRFSVECC